MIADRDEKVAELMPLVKALARRVARNVVSADLDDLVSDGCLGLLQALDRFESERGSTLEAYARPLILGAMFTGLRQRDSVSVRVRRKLREADETRFELAQHRGTLPSMTEMEHIVPNLRKPVMKAYQRASVSLDAPLPEGQSVPPDQEANPEAAAVARAMYTTMRNAIDTLPDRLRVVIYLHYYQGATIATIAEKLEVTPQRASQLHRGALEALKERLNANS